MNASSIDDSTVAAPAPADIQSNAFNFLSFIQHGVDPRTGMYTTGISLPDVVANDLMGPSLSSFLSLGFDPLHTINDGLGLGWRMRLSRYDRLTKRLALSSGESYRALDTGPRFVIEDQKSRHFKIIKQNGALFVHYKSGMVECLSNGNGLYDTFLPETLYSPEGRRITLRYSIVRGERLLNEVCDEMRSLLSIERATGQVHITLYPGSAFAATYRLILQNERVTEIRLPVDGADGPASWRIQYQQLEGLQCISHIASPNGAIETILPGKRARACAGRTRESYSLRDRTHPASYLGSATHSQNL